MIGLMNSEKLLIISLVGLKIIFIIEVSSIL